MLAILIPARSAVRRKAKPSRRDKLNSLSFLDHLCAGTRQIPADWVRGVDGAKVLKEIFAELSENLRIGSRSTSYATQLRRLNEQQKREGQGTRLSRQGQKRLGSLGHPARGLLSTLGPGVSNLCLDGCQIQGFVEKKLEYE
jgi:hypothetical protein